MTEKPLNIFSKEEIFCRTLGHSFLFLFRPRAVTNGLRMADVNGYKIKYETIESTISDRLMGIQGRTLKLFVFFQDVSEVVGRLCLLSDLGSN